MRSHYPFSLFHQWLLLVGLTGAAIYFLWDQKILLEIFEEDTTRITWLVFFIATGSCVHCGIRCIFLSVEQNRLKHCLAENKTALCNKGTSKASTPVCEYLDAVKQDAEHQSIHAELLAEKLSGNHQIGWFITGLVIKLGLLGTVIGFVIMLTSISGLEALDLSDIKQLMQQMTQGMGVAMNTTMVGLVASMLLGLQYLMLDRFADRLVVDVVEMGFSKGWVDHHIESAGS